MNDVNEDYIYGPVPSRRLGRSLGVDLLPAKICSYNCVYCQLGNVRATTVKRRAYRTADKIMEQLMQRLADDIAVDCITLAGSGEPTLNSDIGRVIKEIKARTALPVVVLTNGSLLWDPKVRDALMPADIVIPSLDAHNAELFKTINRSHAAIDFNRMVDGMITFAGEFPGELWLEIFIMEGINDSLQDAEAFLSLVKKIGPDKIYVNTAVRPPAEDFVKPVSDERIAEFHNILDGRPQQDVCFTGARSDAPPADSDGKTADSVAKDVYVTIARRPVTLEDIVAGMGLPKDRVNAGLDTLLAEKKIEKVDKDGRIYYRVVDN